jgi:hypothetical protein
MLLQMLLLHQMRLLLLQGCCCERCCLRRLLLRMLLLRRRLLLRGVGLRRRRLGGRYSVVRFMGMQDTNNAQDEVRWADRKQVRPARLGGGGSAGSGVRRSVLGGAECDTRLMLDAPTIHA